MPEPARDGNFWRMESSARHLQHAEPRPPAPWKALVVALFVSSGCAKEAPPKVEEVKTSETVVAESTLATMPKVGGECPTFGLWQACNVEDRISRAGLAVNRREEGVRHEFMSVEGLVWETSRAEIQVFLYASEADRKKDTDQLDTVFVSPPGKRIMWRWPAQLVTSNNMAAIILSLNGRQAERIALALGAGLPVR
jgi:hypothetical protein